MNYTLLFDGQCTICRYLVKKFIEPYQPKNLKAKPYQEAQFEGHYPPAELERCNAEIILVDESNGQFLGGVEALAQTLQLTGQKPWLQKLLRVEFLKPFSWFFYRLVAWHRYTWFVVPPYLRCSECELSIPPLWNWIFFLVFGAVLFKSSTLNVLLWLSSIEAVAASLFATLKQTPLLLAILTVVLSSAIFLAFGGLSFGLYKKALGVNRLEVFKQYLWVSTIGSLVTLLVLFVSRAAFAYFANQAGFLNAKWLFILTVSILSAGFALTQCLVFVRWGQIGFGKLKAISILFLDWLLRSVSLFGVLYFV